MSLVPAKCFCVANALTFLLAVFPASAQSQSTAATTPGAAPVEQMRGQAPVRFEVASIRPHRSTGNDPSNRQILPGGRFVATATSVRALVRIAFGTDDTRIAGAPSWIDNKTFDINAITTDHAEVTSPQQFQQLLLALLEDRFQFKFHREQREAAVYWLELDRPGKPGPALKPSGPDAQQTMSNNSNGSTMTMKATKVSMADLAAALRRQAGRPVEDHTDLKGNFDFQIDWTPDEAVDSADPSLFAALKEQVGLKLQPAKGTTETIVIDQVAEPSDN
jgi:uncharacterized protein (TIGR03435 family)